ncbi:MAG: tRNA (N6-isopentenyl adenosine(37)-C2)-methylthiotransferase MiaB, partial [Chloroflexi bacterium]|nr:tRNA (N6-isopentenyl adenosine(37)-C2)-methylthiotransferase MiaB [Chloroflexota bacterium]
MPSYHLWTVGCQMNVADSERLGAALERLGYVQEPVPEKADIVVLNSCVVRQGAEDKVVARLDSLKGLKRGNPGAAIALMGCMVGPRTEALQRRFPHVDFFLRPQEFQSLVEFAAGRQGLACDTDLGLLVPSR